MTRTDAMKLEVIKVNMSKAAVMVLIMMGRDGDGDGDGVATLNSSCCSRGFRRPVDVASDNAHVANTSTKSPHIIFLRATDKHHILRRW